MLLFSNNNYLKKIFFSITWMSFFLSINLNPTEFYEFNILDKIRILLPIIFIIISIFFIKNINYVSLLKFDSIIFILIFFLYSFFNFKNVENNLLNLFWPLYMFLAFFFITSILNDEERNFLIKITIFILFVAFILYFSLGLIEMIKSNNINFYGIMGSNESYSGFKNPPRSSGLARISLILFSYFFLYFLIKSDIRDNNKNLIYLICFFATITILFQSRTISFILLNTTVILIVFYYKVILKNKKILLFVIFIPIFVGSLYNWFKYEYSYRNFYNEAFVTYDTKTELLTNVIKNSVIRDQNSDNKNNFSSGRFENWNKAYNIISSDLLNGYGPQSDRLLINQSIHNAFLYTSLSGSIIAGLMIIVIYLRTLYFLIKFLKFHKNFKKIFFICAPLLLIIILNQRSILETSFAIYSVDYLIFILSYIILKNNIIEIKKV